MEPFTPDSETYPEALRNSLDQDRILPNGSSQNLGLAPTVLEKRFAKDDPSPLQLVAPSTRRPTLPSGPFSDTDSTIDPYASTAHLSRMPSSPPSSPPPSRPASAMGHHDSVALATKAGLDRRKGFRSGFSDPSSNSFEYVTATERTRSPSRSAGHAGEKEFGAGNIQPINNVPGLTSYPISLVMKDIEFSVKKLLSEKVFDAFMEDSLGRHRFREFLQTTSEGTDALDSYLDLKAFGSQSQELHKSAIAMSDLYFAGSVPINRLPLPSRLRDQLLDAFVATSQVRESLERPKKHLLRSLYSNQFQAFIKYKLVEAASVRLGKYNMSREDRKGLGDCFCLTNPRQQDHPIVLVSGGFEAVTGYSAKSIVGRNCRFLQGPATSPASVQRIRDALDHGETTTTLLLNYRKDGEAFYNLLCLIPLRDATGAVVYFIGGQVNVTGMLSQRSGLSFLVGSESAEDTYLPPTSSLGFSPSMQAYIAALDSTETVDPAPSKVHRAAGVVNDEGFSKSARLFVPPERPESRNGNRGGLTKVARFFRLKRKNVEEDWIGAGEDGFGGSQQILGAEGQLDQKGGTVDNQVQAFSDIYQKVVVFRAEQRRIIFVTEPFLRFCGLPHATPLDRFSPKILHQDILELLVANEKSETGHLKKTLKVVINSGSSFSVPCGVKSQLRSVISGRITEVVKYGCLHLTPMKDPEGSIEAFMAVFA